jgi:hypothetical protein
MAMGKISAQLYYPRKMPSLLYMALLREYHISDMFSQDYKITLKGNQYIEDQVRTPSPKEILIVISNLDLDPAAKGA